MLVNVGSASAYVALATIQGGLVALPSPVTLDRLRRLRSPAWALAAPAAIVIGTFGVLALPGGLGSRPPLSSPTPSARRPSIRPRSGG